MHSESNTPQESLLYSKWCGSTRFAVNFHQSSHLRQTILRIEHLNLQELTASTLHVSRRTFTRFFTYLCPFPPFYQLASHLNYSLYLRYHSQYLPTYLPASISITVTYSVPTSISFTMPPKRVAIQPAARRSQPRGYISSVYHSLTSEENASVVISVAMFGVRTLNAYVLSISFFLFPRTCSRNLTTFPNC